MSVRIANEVLIPEIAAHLRAGKDVLFTPSGNSMRPFIEGERDSVVLRYSDTVRVGDICLVAMRGPRDVHYVLHRVIRVEDDRVTLMGDGNLQGEEHVRRDDVLGTVVRILSPNGRTKPLTRGRLWYALLRWRPFALKVYRHTVVPYCYPTKQEQQTTTI